jgi:hypothetical protein
MVDVFLKDAAVTVILCAVALRLLVDLVRWLLPVRPRPAPPSLAKVAAIRPAVVDGEPAPPDAAGAGVDASLGAPALVPAAPAAADAAAPSPASGILWVDDETRQNVTLIVLGLAVVLGVFWWLGGDVASDAAGNAHMDERVALGRVLYATLGRLNVPYYRPDDMLFTDTDQSVPIVDCAYHGLAKAIQDEILGPERKPKGKGHEQVPALYVASPPKENPRQVATRMCVLHDDHIISLDQSTHQHEGHVQRPPWWHFRTLSAPPVHELLTAVTPSLIVASDGEVYYTSVAVAQLPGQPGPRLQPVLLRHTDLVQTATAWYTGMLKEAQTRRLLPDAPCLCPEHFGLLQSHLHWSYNGSAWEVWPGVQLARNVSTTKGAITEIPYNPNMVFPSSVEKQYYHVSEVEHYGRVELAYTDVPRAVALARHHVHGEHDESRSVYAHVIGTQADLVEHHAELNQQDTACYHHCRALAAEDHARLMGQVAQLQTSS